MIIRLIGPSKRQILSPCRAFGFINPNIVLSTIHPIDHKDWLRLRSEFKDGLFIGFHATWFEGCTPFFENAEKVIADNLEQSRIPLVKIDIDKFLYIAHDLNIKTIPKIVYMENNAEITSIEGDNKSYAQIAQWLHSVFLKAKKINTLD